jgi:hypothetical protein
MEASRVRGSGRSSRGEDGIRLCIGRWVMGCGLLASGVATAFGGKVRVGMRYHVA